MDKKNKLNESLHNVAEVDGVSLGNSTLFNLVIHKGLAKGEPYMQVWTIGQQAIMFWAHGKFQAMNFIQAFKGMSVMNNSSNQQVSFLQPLKDRSWPFFEQWESVSDLIEIWQ